MCSMGLFKNFVLNFSLTFSILNPFCKSKNQPQFENFLDKKA